MNTAGYYKKAMDIVQKKGLGDEMIKIIAKSHPSIVCKAYDSVGKEPWMIEIEGLLRDGKKINAIKLHRVHTGLGLKESKEAVEKIEI